jgi:UDP-N-acetylmuramyl tripeptide synthase
MTATAVAERAWVRAEAYIAAQDDAARTVADLAHDLPPLRAALADERARLHPVVALAREAAAHHLAFQLDDEACSAGSGAGGVTWLLDALPASTAVLWETLYDVPTVLVTGSNGKTTTTRLVAAMFRAAGCTTGWSCSDGVWVARDDERRELGTGDYTGPAGARLVLRDRTVQAAVLETARGGMLRRGLATTRATAAVITNISMDHFGEYGVHSLRDLAEVKGVVTRVVGEDGFVVLNADDPELVALAPSVGARIVWFSTRAGHPLVRRGVAAHGHGAELDDGRVRIAEHGGWADLGPVEEMPITMLGAARYNVANVLAAAVAANCAGVRSVALRATLACFGASGADNAGRLHRSTLGGVTVLTDYAHNPEGIRALAELAASLPAQRRLLVLGQAGNRDDEQLRALAVAAWAALPADRVILKEMPTMLRGRAPGEIPAVLRRALEGAGAPPARISVAPTEFDAVREALAWAEPGDLLVLPTHTERARVGDLLARLDALGWHPGEPLPD